MKKNWTIFKLVALAMVTLLLMSACGGSKNNDDNASGGKDADGKVKLTMSAWGNPEEIKGYQKALDAYEAENDNVVIDLIPVPSDSYEQKLFTQLSGGNAPDIFYAGDSYISKLIETGKLADLTAFLDTEDSFVKAGDFPDGIWGGSKKGDDIYGVSVDSNPLLMYYNKNVLEAAGVEKSPQEHYDDGTWNWDTFKEMTGQLVAAGKKGYVAESSGTHTLSWVWSNGGELYNEDGDIVLESNEKAREAFDYIGELVSGDHVTYAGTLPDGQGGDAMFMSNQVGFVTAGRWLTPMFSENETLDFDYIPWPTNTGNKMEPAAIATAYLSASSDSKHLDEAMKFLSFYTSQVGQKSRLEGNGNAVPTVAGIDELITNIDIPEHASYLIDAREIGIVDAQQNTVPGLEKELRDIMDLFYLGQQDAETTMEKYNTTAQKMIEEYRAELNE